MSVAETRLEGATLPKRNLRLLSYNIQTGIASTRPHHYLTQSWKHVLPHAQSLDNLSNIARLISDYDMVALQEVDAGSLRSNFINQAEFLAHHGQFPFWSCQTNRNLGKIAQNSNALMSKFCPAEVSDHKLPGLPGRGAMLVRYGEKDSALVLLLIHLALGQRARLRQLAYISELVNEYQHVVLMGDLNCQPESLEMDTLFKNTNLREPVPGLKTFPSWRPQRNIDHILVTPSLQLTNIRVLSDSFSDHLPIAVEIALPSGIQLDAI